MTQEEFAPAIATPAVLVSCCTNGTVADAVLVCQAKFAVFSLVEDFS